MAFHIVFGIALLSFAIHLWMIRDRGLSSDRVVELGLLYLLAGVWGIGGALFALPHILIPDEIAGYVGWPPGGLFQVELGFASLGTSIVAILCIWLRGWFWLSPIVAKSVFLLGAAYLHVRDVVESQNFEPGNAGPVLFYDLAIPFLTIVLFLKYRKSDEFRRASADPLRATG